MKFRNIITDFFKILALFCLVAGLASCSFDKKESSEEKAKTNKEESVSIVLKIKGLSKEMGLLIQPSEDEYTDASTMPSATELEKMKFEIKYCKGSSITQNARTITNLSYSDFDSGIPIEGLSAEEWTFRVLGQKGEENEDLNIIIYSDELEGIASQQLNYGNNSIQIELKRLGNGVLTMDFYTLTSFGNENPVLSLYYYDEAYYSSKGISYIDFLKAFTSANPENESNGIIRTADVTTLTLEQPSSPSISETIQDWGIPENSTTVKKYSISYTDSFATYEPGMYFAKLTIGQTVLLSEQLKIVPDAYTKHEFIYAHDKKEIKYNVGTGNTTDKIIDFLTDEEKEIFKEYHYDTYFKGIQKELKITPVREGYTFAGWKYESGGDLTFSSENGSYIFVNDTDVDYVTIVAKWN